jgi:chaperonin GroEL
VVEKVHGLKAGKGLSAATGDYGDLVSDGVIDPMM